MLDRPATRMSAGERAQVVIMIGVLRRPSIIVIDETAKHLHPTVRAKMRAALAREFPDAIIIEVVHELPVSRAFTRVLVLEDGALVEDGTHEALLALGGRYAHYVADAEGPGR
jgi:ABC-type multidrug transport system fused ATPase/permease subunit